MGKTLGLESIAACEGIGTVSEDKKYKTFCMVLAWETPEGDGGKGPWQRGEEQRGGTPGARGTQKQVTVSWFQNYLGNNVETVS